MIQSSFVLLRTRSLVGHGGLGWFKVKIGGRVRLFKTKVGEGSEMEASAPIADKGWWRILGKVEPEGC